MAERERKTRQLPELSQKLNEVGKNLPDEVDLNDLYCWDRSENSPKDWIVVIKGLTVYERIVVNNAIGLLNRGVRSLKLKPSLGTL